MEAIHKKSRIFVKKVEVMNTTELQSSLLELVTKVQDQKFLKAVIDLMNSHLEIVQQKEKDWYDELPEYVKNELDEALAESERGEEGIPHEEFMKQIKEEYNIAI